MQIRCWKSHRRMRPRPLIRPDAGSRDCLAVIGFRVIGIWVAKAHPRRQLPTGWKRET